MAEDDWREVRKARERQVGGKSRCWKEGALEGAAADSKTFWNLRPLFPAPRYSAVGCSRKGVIGLALCMPSRTRAMGLWS